MVRAGDESLATPVVGFVVAVCGVAGPFDGPDASVTDLTGGWAAAHWPGADGDEVSGIRNQPSLMSDWREKCDCTARPKVP
jgi:hypothetical protein